MKYLPHAQALKLGGSHAQLATGNLASGDPLSSCVRLGDAGQIIWDGR